jgi:hypothetical protein
MFCRQRPQRAAANPIGAKKLSPGIAVTPKHFPEHTIADVEEAFELSRTPGNYSVFIYQWQHLDLEIAELMLSWSRNAGMTPIKGFVHTQQAAFKHAGHEVHEEAIKILIACIALLSSFPSRFIFILLCRSRNYKSEMASGNDSWRTGDIR